jgi:hypothetical protein
VTTSQSLAGVPCTSQTYHQATALVQAGVLLIGLLDLVMFFSTLLEYGAEDPDQAFEPWWKVFNWLCAVIGYRTKAAVGDKEMGEVGKVLGMG